MSDDEKRDTARLGTKPQGGDLDGYIFSDIQHAVEWLSQKFVTDDKYTVTPITVVSGLCPTCKATHRNIVVKSGHEVKPSTFLRKYQS